MNKHIKIFSILFLYLIVMFTLDKVYSQPCEISYTKYSITKGLSQSSVYSIVQDDKGYIWLGTQDGLNRFDGYEFDKIRIEKHGNNIPVNIINCIEKDYFGNLWIGTYMGLFIYDLSKESFIYHEFPNNEVLFERKTITGLFSDSLFMYAISEDGLLRVNLNDTTSELIYPIKSKERSILPFVRNPITGTSDSILFCINKRLYIYSKSKDSIWFNSKYDGMEIITFFKHKGLIMSGTARIKDFKEDVLFRGKTIYTFERVKDEIWVGTDDGIWSIDTLFKESSIKKIKNFPEDKYFDFYIDKSDNLWIATFNNGVLVYDLKNKKFKKGKKTDYEVMSIYKNYDTTWIGTRDKGLLIYKNGKQIIERKTAELGKFVNVIENINNEIWISSSDI